MTDAKEDVSTGVFNDIKTGLEQAIEYEKEKKADIDIEK